MPTSVADSVLGQIRHVGARVRRLNRMLSGIERHSYPDRALHWVHLVSFLLLVYTGLAMYFPALALPVGGIPMVPLLHRFVGIIFIASGVFFMLMFPGRTLELFANYTKWHLRDLVWLIKFPLYLVMPSRVKLPYVSEELNPGEKVVSGLLIYFSFSTAINGLLRWPIPGLPSSLVYRAEAVHQSIFPLFLLFFLGHVFIGSGIHPEYRHVWKGMLGDGVIPSHLARKHWPGWFKEKRFSLKKPGIPQGARLRGLLFLGGLLAASMAFLLVIPGPPLMGVTRVGRVDALPRGEFSTRLEGIGYRVSIREVQGQLPILDIKSFNPTGRDLSSWEVKKALIDTVIGAGSASGGQVRP